MSVIWPDVLLRTISQILGYIFFSWT